MLSSASSDLPPPGSVVVHDDGWLAVVTRAYDVSADQCGSPIELLVTVLDAQGLVDDIVTDLRDVRITDDPADVAEARRQGLFEGLLLPEDPED